MVVTRFERVELDSSVDCDASDAVRTKDSPLTTRLALSVPGPGS